MGYRWMYYMTGMPGWVRWGFSPGWIGRSPNGLPPAAAYLMNTGQMGNFMNYMTTQFYPYAGAVSPVMSQLPVDQQKTMIEQQIKALETQIENLKKQLEELNKQQ